MNTTTPTHFRKRKLLSPQQPEIASKEPRQMASVQSTYTKSILKVPCNLTISTIGDMLKPISQELDIHKDKESNKCNENPADIEGIEEKKVDEYEGTF